ncbi:hypothetical protein KIN20_034015 [Parelaphostrongylus tenuis]|uniref:Uncharacterized protein n=1 Tax=Parelaphostrongylus tenuis TaxID=148309 RepID=A0AAD5R911_PARTN|nr:hypothetical protein KIN20_034015 [Parelaphostrongylus tenuis]
MLFVFFLTSLPLTESVCVQCASVSLFNQWQLTGLPRFPANLPFTPKCASITVDDTFPSAMNVTQCSSVCFEMIIPFENQYNFVRGCHADFIEVGSTSQRVPSDEKCVYSNVDDQLVIVGDDFKEVKPVAVVHFVMMSTMEISNAKINTKTLSNVPPPFLNKLNCSQTKPINCVKSVYYDGTGEDNTKNSCSSGYCTSVKGKLNGKKYVERGCASIAPYSQDTCVWMNINSSYPSGPGSVSVSRTKRSLSVVLEATECYCTTAYCNSSSKANLLFALVVMSTTIRFLY